MASNIPLIKDIKFVLKWLRWPTREEVTKKAWISGVVMLVIGLSGFLIHTIMTLV